MRYDKIQEEHVARKRVHHKTVCDGCSLDIEADPPFGYDASEVTIDAKIGKDYPEGDFRTMYEVDVCPACFVGRVVPALAAAGIVVRTRDADDYSASVLTQEGVGKGMSDKKDGLVFSVDTIPSLTIIVDQVDPKTVINIMLPDGRNMSRAIGDFVVLLESAGAFVGIERGSRTFSVCPACGADTIDTNGTGHTEACTLVSEYADWGLVATHQLADPVYCRRHRSGMTTKNIYADKTGWNTNVTGTRVSELTVGGIDRARMWADVFLLSQGLLEPSRVFQPSRKEGQA